MRKILVLGSGIVSLVLLLSVTAAKATHGAGKKYRLDDRLTVYGTVWGHTLAQDGSGFYNEIFADLAGTGEDAPKHDYKLMPYKRAHASFLDGGSACLYPSARTVLKKEGRVSEPLIETQALFPVREHLFTPAGSQPPVAFADLKGKTVAIQAGSIMSGLLRGAGATLIEVHDETARARLLIAGRVDMMSGMLPNEHLVFSALGMPMAAYDRNFPLFEAGAAIVCHDTPKTRSFIQYMNGRIEILRDLPAFRDKLVAAGTGEIPEMVAETLRHIEPAAGGRMHFVHPGRRLPFSNIR